METESGRSSIRGNIYFAARKYPRMNILSSRADLVGTFGSKVSLFEIHVLPLLQEVRPNVLLASVSHLNVTLKQEYYSNPKARKPTFFLICVASEYHKENTLNLI